RGAHCAATDLVIGTEAQPGGTMLVGRPCMPSEAHLCEDDVDRHRLESGHWRAIHASDPVQMGTEIKGGVVPLRLPMGGRRWGSGVVGKIDQGLKGAEDALHVLIAGCDVLLGKIIERE